MIRIAVGSKNPVKVQAASSAFEQLGMAVEATGYDVESGVSSQPFSDEETIRGAVNRARAALEMADGFAAGEPGIEPAKAGCDFGIGLEGGVVDTPQGMFVCNWGAIVDRNGNVGVGGGHRVLLPDRIAELLRQGQELGHVIDPFVGKDDVRRKEGTIGFLTGNQITRQSMFRDVTICAYARFLNPELYQG